MRSKISLLLLLVSLLPATRAAASGEGAYSLTVPAQGYTYGYATPFAVSSTFTQSGAARVFSGSSAPKLYRLMEEEGETAVVAYCGDGAVPWEKDARYRRTNLEDSTWFSDAAAGRLRAVILASYPWQGTAGIEAEANAWLRQQELPELRELQSGEAILASQIALWKLTGGRSYTVHSLYDGTVDLAQFRRSVVSQRELTQQPTKHTRQNIESLYAYLYNLPGEDPADTLISDAAITRTVYTYTAAENGLYTADIAVTIAAQIRQGDRLTLTAVCDEEIISQPLTAAGEYHISFPDLTHPSMVKLSNTGEQYGEDVFLFLAEGDREASKPFLGFDSASRPVHCEKILMPVLSAP